MRILTTIFLLFPVFLLISQGCTTKSTSGVNDVTDTIVTTERRFTFLTDSIDDKNFPEWLVQNKFTFEVGGNSKNKSQIYDVNNAFLAIDDIEYGYENRIPLWLFGFLY